MEYRLSALFDWQRFAQNPRLSQQIAETEGRYGGVLLSEDDLDQVWAAGGLFPPPTEKQTHERS